MDLVYWAMILGAMSILFFIIELFVPSGGLLGLISGISLIGLIIVLFMIDTTYGTIGLVSSIFLVPLAIFLGLKIFPHTPVGRSLILTHEQDAEDIQYSSTGIDDTDNLLGAEGVTVSELRPVGTCQLGGRHVECLAVSGVIDPGVRVKVVEVAGIEVKVRPV